MAQALQSIAKHVGQRVDETRRRPLADYTILAIVVGLLTIIGVTLVASSSMTWSISAGGSAWTTAVRQTVMVILGLVAGWFALRMPLRLLRKASTILLGFSIFLLVLVLSPLGTGYEQVGSQSWLVLGPLSFQPSEIARIAIAVWGASYLANREPGEKLLPRHLYIFLGISAVMCALIAAEHDTGMAVAFLIVVFALAVFAGLDNKILFAAVGAGFLVLVAIALGGGYRSDRISVYFDALTGNFQDTSGKAYQSYQGFLSLADGSLTGVGLGQSRAKWFYLPEAKNDFIFAVVGEELGFVGAAVVILLFATLGVIGFRTAKRSSNMYLSLLAAALTSSVVVQAFVNIGYVIGLVPVTGIQLPLISAGGTSAIITLTAMGVLLNCARHEPEAISAMRSYGRPAMDRLLGLPEPSLDDVVSKKTPREQAQDRVRRAPSRDPRAARKGAQRPPATRTGSLNNRSGGPRQAPHRDRRRR
ncbi:FtsW/RodA/SpoVE family cell cycle protein [Corynebacterium gerontici]|uniref:Probable peptidoglycan glycosyltransferase FtsW n=1 Tax=Corynebacterium gerontici TaxID=2079234 RepID=A0A3G6J484_9CORY|nr:putative peptidoglycan glycosyltransferase FtsW [Corynebacterium gerontici]AZA11768.1 Lipid II flippase FtsW [Corynebacterium gerontici]